MEWEGFGGRGPHGSFERGFGPQDHRFFHWHRHVLFGFDFFAFGFPDWWYVGYGYPDYGYPSYDSLTTIPMMTPGRCMTKSFGKAWLKECSRS
jgi:hypothetical protein